MNRLIIMAAAAATGLGTACAAEDNGQGTARNWRLTVGGLARGSMKAQVGDLGSKRCEAYGAELDFQYRAFQAGDFSLWTGLGGTYVPKQKMGSWAFAEIDNSDPAITLEDYGTGKMEAAVGEFRLLLVPEYALTERWTVGARMGVAFDWVRATFKLSEWGFMNDRLSGISFPYGPYSETDRVTDFVAQAILGLETTYMLTDSFGLYANIDYRCGGNATFEADGDRLGELNMDGWCAGVGAVIVF